MEDQVSLQLDLTDNGLSHNLAESTDSLQNKTEKNHNSSNRVEKAIAAEPIESHQDDDLIRELEEKGSNLQDTRDLLKDLESDSPCPIPSETEIAPINTSITSKLIEIDQAKKSDDGQVDSTTQSSNNRKCSLDSFVESVPKRVKIDNTAEKHSAPDVLNADTQPSTSKIDSDTELKLLQETSDGEELTSMQIDTNTTSKSNDAAQKCVVSSADVYSKTAPDSETLPDSGKPELAAEPIPVERIFDIRIVYEGTELKSFTVERSQPSIDTAKAAAKRNSISKRSVDKTEVDESEYEPNQSKGKSKTVTCTSTELTETSKSLETPSSPEARLSGGVDAKKSGRRTNERENSASLADTVSQNDSVSEYSDGNGSVHYQPEEWPPEIIDSYEIVRQLGSGSFGHVYLASHRDTIKHMAIKRIKRNLSANMPRYASNDRIDLEVNVTRSLTDPNIIDLHNVYSKGDYVYMMMEFMAGGTLSGRINESGVFDEDIAKFYLRQLCSGLNYMHNRHLAHFDLKPDNLLLLSNHQRTILKVADFGMCESTRNGPVRPNYGGTIYSAPEVVNRDMCTCAADVWSIGVIMVVMLCGKVPFENISAVRDSKFDTKVIQCIAEAGKIFLKNIFKDDPKSRPDIGSVLSDTWLV